MMQSIGETLRKSAPNLSPTPAPLTSLSQRLVQASRQLANEMQAELTKEEPAQAVRNEQAVRQAVNAPPAELGVRLAASVRPPAPPPRISAGSTWSWMGATQRAVSTRSPFDPEIAPANESPQNVDAPEVRPGGPEGQGSSSPPRSDVEGTRGASPQAAMDSEKRPVQSADTEGPGARFDQDGQNKNDLQAALATDAGAVQANFAGEAPTGEGATDYSESLATVEEYYEVFDNPGDARDGDGKIGTRDFEAIASGDYDEQALRQRLADQGLSSSDIDRQMAQIEEAAEFFASSDTHRNMLLRADEDGNGLATREELQKAREQADPYDQAVARHQNVEQIDSPQQAIAILTDFSALADTADGGGNRDGEISRDDLSAILDDPNAPASLRAAATYLLDERNAVIFNAVDGAGAEGSANGKINLYNLQQAKQAFGEFGQGAPEGPVESTAQAAIILGQYGYLADAASGGGDGASDGIVSFDDLERLAESEAVPDSVREAATYLLEQQRTNQDTLLPFVTPWSNAALELDVVHAFSEAPEVLQQALTSHFQSESGEYVRFKDGQAVWADNGEPLSAEEYTALQSQWEKQVGDPAGVVLLDSQYGYQLEGLQQKYASSIGGIQDELGNQSQRIADENDRFARFMAEYSGALNPQQIEQLTAAHEQRIDELTEPLEEQAGEWIAMAEDPTFQAAFQNFTDEQKAQFFETMANSVGVTERGQEFINGFLEDLEGDAGGPNRDNPYVDAVQTLLASSSDASDAVQSVVQSITTTANRALFTGGANPVSVERYVGVARSLFGDQYADELDDALTELRRAGQAGDLSAFQAARANLEGRFADFPGSRVAGATEFFSVGALALDALLIQQNGWDQLAQPEFALSLAADAVDTAAILARVFSPGAHTLEIVGRLGAGLGALSAAFTLADGIADRDGLTIASGGLQLLGYGLIAFGVGGPVGPVLAIVGAGLGFLGLFEEDPYAEYRESQFEQLGLDSGPLQIFSEYPQEVKDAVQAYAEQHDLEPSVVAALVTLGAGNGGLGLPETAEDVQEAISLYFDPEFTPGLVNLEGENGDAFFRVLERTGLDNEDVFRVATYAAQDEYLAYLRNHPELDNLVTLQEFTRNHFAEFAGQIDGAIDDAREAGWID